MVQVQELTEYEPIISLRGRKVRLMTSFKVTLVHGHRHLLSFLTGHYAGVFHGIGTPQVASW